MQLLLLAPCVRWLSHSPSTLTMLVLADLGLRM
jgi:hypothetical protein